MALGTSLSLTKAVKNLKLNYSFNKHFLSCQALSDPWGQSKCALTPRGIASWWARRI